MSHANANVHQSNIFIDEDWHVRLADFGLAGWADATLGSATSIHGGSVRWMAPELHTSEIFHRETPSDVYAFACVAIEVRYSYPSLYWQIPFSDGILLQCYTCQHPFYDILRDHTVTMKVMKGERPHRPTPDMGRTMSNGMWGLVEACWKQDPSERLQMVDVVVQMSMWP